MSTRHTVKPGESTSSIAWQYGHAPDTLWDDPENAALRKERTHADVLLPGDVLVVRDIVPKAVPVATGRRHRFRRKGVPSRFQVQLCDAQGPRPALDYELDVDGVIAPGKTDGEGWIHAWVPPGAREIKLLVGGAVERIFKIGHLDPIDARTGQASRLRSLGFLHQDADAEEDLRAALRAFQFMNELDPTGEADEATLRKLAEVYGC